MIDRSTIFISATDMFLCVLAVVIVAVAPKAPPTSAPLAAQKIVTADWPVKDYDADVDLWVLPPHGRPVFFGHRQEGLLGLDQDNKGWADSRRKTEGGGEIVLDRAKEMVSFRGLEPGHYDVAVNLYSFRPHGNQDRDHAAVPIHVEVVSINPVAKVEFSKDVVLNVEPQTINTVSFNMDAKGDLTFVDPPLQPITAYR